LKFKDVLSLTSWEDVSDILAKEYADEIESLPLYQKMYNSLNVLETISNGMEIHVRYVKDKEDGSSWYDVYGTDGTTIKEDENYQESWGDPDSLIKYGIEYRAWGQWLGMHVDLQDLENLGPSRFTAHCLAEIAWGGFTQEEATSHLNEIQKRSEEVKELLKDPEKAKEEGKLIEMDEDFFSRIKDVLDYDTREEED
jgi:hypothetical protein